jgi:hypothetical protein
VPTLVRVPLTSVVLPRMKLLPALSAVPPPTKTPVPFPVAAEWASRRTAPEFRTKPVTVLLAAALSTARTVAELLTGSVRESLLEGAFDYIGAPREIRTPDPKFDCVKRRGMAKGAPYPNTWRAA